MELVLNDRVKSFIDETSKGSAMSAPITFLVEGWTLFQSWSEQYHYSNQLVCEIVWILDLIDRKPSITWMSSFCFVRSNYQVSDLLTNEGHGL